ncbi:hypothetical protein Sjap_020231 [Stephania japonica]|uniref:Pentatricopeptide repeat-containing protein n=1 Tax=Stephania japonica TaxID=461633 RepID=A0AAP0F5T6_9MAGN
MVSKRANLDHQNPMYSNNVVSWTIHISNLAKHDSHREKAMIEASRMRSFGIEPNSYTLVCLINTSIELGWILYGKELHCYVVQSGFSSNVYIGSSLISFYAKSELLTEAQKVFDEIPCRNIVAWNSLICGYVQSGRYREAMSLVVELERSDVGADSFTINAALTACAQQCLLDFGQTIHSRIVKLGLNWNVVVQNCLIHMYGECGCVDEGVKVFNEITHKDPVSWNSVIGASAANGRLSESLNFLKQMPCPDTISYNEVIHGIAQFGNIEDAVRFLSRMPNPSPSSWNSVLAGYVIQDRAVEALEFFAKMRLEGVEQDEFTHSTILKGVSSLSALTWGRVVHSSCIKSGLDTSVICGSALVDMYSKCGEVSSAELVFHSLPKKNLVSWNTMLAGYAHNGKASEVIRLFEQLKTVPGLAPDDLTFLSVLSACAQGNAGDKLQLGSQYFESMTKEYKISPTVEHCTCMIGILGRRGEAWRAKEMIQELGYWTFGSVWKALFSACCWNGDVKGAETTAAKVIELDGEDELVYVQLSNLYAYHGRWREVSGVRRHMKEIRLLKEPGCSWLEMENLELAYSIEKSS